MCEKEPATATDVLRYDTENKKWEEVGHRSTRKRTTPPRAQQLCPLTTGILRLGGVNHDIFLDAITTQYTIGHDQTLTDEKVSATTSSQQTT